MNRIVDYVRANQDRFLSELKAFCDIPSVTGDRRECERAAQFLYDYMEKLGVNPKRVDTEGNPLLFGSTDPEKPVGLTYYSHYDVVPPGNVDQWTTPPFETTIRDGRVYGRGVADHKGWLLSRLQGLCVLRELGLELPRNVQFLIEGDEEEGSGPMQRHAGDVRAHLGDGVVLYSGWQRLADGTPRINGGGRGILELAVRTVNARVDLHSAYAPLVRDPLLALVKLVSQMIGHDGSLQVDGFYDGAIPPDDDDLECLRQVPFDLARETERLGLQGFNGVTSASERLDVLRQLYFTPVGTAHSFTSTGNPGSVVPSQAEVRLKFSLVPDQDPDDVAEKVVRFIEANASLPTEVTVVRRIAPARTPLRSPGFKIVKAACERWYGRAPVVVPFSSGSGPRDFFIKQLGWDLIVDVGVSHVGSNDHGSNENIYVEHYLEGIIHAAHTMLAAGEGYR